MPSKQSKIDAQMLEVLNKYPHANNVDAILKPLNEGKLKDVQALESLIQAHNPEIKPIKELLANKDFTIEEVDAQIGAIKILHEIDKDEKSLVEALVRYPKVKNREAIIDAYREGKPISQIRKILVDGITLFPVPDGKTNTVTKRQDTSLKLGMG